MTHKDPLQPLLDEIDALRALPSEPARPTGAACSTAPAYEPCTGPSLGPPPGLVAPRRRSTATVGRGVATIGAWARVRAYRGACWLGRTARAIGRFRIDGDKLAGWVVLLAICMCAYSCVAWSTRQADDMRARVGAGDLGLGEKK